MFGGLASKAPPIFESMVVPHKHCQPDYLVDTNMDY